MDVPQDLVIGWIAGQLIVAVICIIIAYHS